MLTIILFFIGFVALVKGAEVLIEGASILAKRFGISELIIGLTVVAFGTSLPELIISLFANAHEISDLAVSNVLGSNIANTLLVLGVGAVIYPLSVHRVTVWREVLFSVLASVMLGVLILDSFIGSGGLAGLDRIDGIVLMSYFVIFLYYSFGSSRVNRVQAERAIDGTQNISIASTFLKITAGIVGLYLGGEWIIDGASYFAEIFGMSESLIGLSIVAVGTSLPELAAVVVATQKRNVDIAVGSVVGSNLFNILWVLGLNAVVRPLEFPHFLLADVSAMVIAGLLLFSILISGKKHVINKTHGYAFISVYCVYIALTIFRG